MSWGVVAAVAACAAGLGAWAIRERMKRSSERRHVEEETRRELIGTMNLQRHDLMNDLQVLLGYIQLNKQEKVKSYVDAIASRLQEDSAIAKLENAALTVALYAFRAGANQVRLHVDVEQGLTLTAFGERGRLAAEAVTALVQCGEAAVQEGAEADLTVSLAHNERLCITFEYKGSYDQDKLERLIRQQLDRLHRDDAAKAAIEYDASAARLTLRF